MEKAKTIERLNLTAWMDESLAAQRDDGNARHVDELSDCPIANGSRQDFLSSLLRILDRANRHLSQKANHTAPWTSFVLASSIGTSREITLWNDSLWDSLRLMDEPPSLYVLNTNQFFDLDGEEYHRTVACPITLPFAFSTIFRSFRPSLGLDSLWEFENCFYFLIKK